MRRCKQNTYYTSKLYALVHANSVLRVRDGRWVYLAEYVVYLYTYAYICKQHQVTNISEEPHVEIADSIIASRIVPKYVHG